VQLNREDMEFMWNEIILYLNVVLVAAFMFIALYAWKISQNLSFLIAGLDFVLVLSVLANVIRRTKSKAMKNPYITEKYMNELGHFVEKEIDEYACTKDKEITMPSMLRTLCNAIESAYKKGFKDGERK